MKTKKMSLATLQGKLSRNEMKKIMAGSGSGNGGRCGDSCINPATDCLDPSCSKCISQNGGPYVCR